MRNYLNNNRNWERNEGFFGKFKAQLAESGNPEYVDMFFNLENYIRWKGKEDSTKYSGKSMLRNITFIF